MRYLCNITMFVAKHTDVYACWKWTYCDFRNALGPSEVPLDSPKISRPKSNSIYALRVVMRQRATVDFR